MSISSHLQLGSVEALVVRKPIKNLHLSVLPPNGRVRVTAPANMKDDAIRTLLALRLPWIKKQQAKFTNQERQAKRDYSSGESHYFLGKRYRLEVVYKDEVPVVFLKGRTKIILQVRPNSSVIKRREVVMDWYRKELYIILDSLVTKWQKKIGVKAKSWGIKQMKTRWGTCNHNNKRILLNLELVKKPIVCIEYVVVHELIHLIEKKHNEKFTGLLAKNFPKWRSVKEELNSLILSYEEWG
ncbi:MAG: SprT family zinc-dependent metalloprotease [Candidatus Paceibacterota bacterium]